MLFFWLMRHFPFLADLQQFTRVNQSEISNNQKFQIFNYRLSRARWVVENAFSIFVLHFCIYQWLLILSPNMADVFVKNTCVLSNYVMKSSNNMAQAVEHGEIKHAWNACICAGNKCQKLFKTYI